MKSGAAKAQIKLNLKQDQNERIDKWKYHFENLLGKPPNIIDRPTERIIDQELKIKKVNFTKEELETVIKKQSNGKACGKINGKIT